MIYFNVLGQHFFGFGLRATHHRSAREKVFKVNTFSYIT